MYSVYDDSAGLDWARMHVKSLHGSLSPASRLVWIALRDLAFSQSTDCLEGSVRSICTQLGLCDKTFKKAVDELQKNQLLTLRKIQTGLGAHSFQYVPAPPYHVALRKVGALYSNYRNVLLREKCFGFERVTVSQRMLLIAVLAITDGCAFVTELHVPSLSKLTGLPNRNVVSNLSKLEAKGLLILKTSTRAESPHRKVLWAYQLDHFAQQSEMRCVFDRNAHSEVNIISLLIRRREIEKKFCSLNHNQYNRWAKEQFGMTSSAVESYLYDAFSGAPRDIREPLLEAINSSRMLWQQLSRKGCLVYVDWLLQLAAIETIHRQSNEAMFDMYNQCLHTENLIKAQVQFFPLTTEQKELLARILIPLSKLVATAMTNEINDVPPEIELDQCQILVESFSQLIANRNLAQDPVCHYGLIVLKYEPRYTKR